MGYLRAGMNSQGIFDYPYHKDMEISCKEFKIQFEKLSENLDIEDTTMLMNFLESFGKHKNGDCVFTIRSLVKYLK